MLTVRVDYALV